MENTEMLRIKNKIKEGHDSDLSMSAGSPTDTQRLDWLMSHDDGDVVLEMVNREMIDEYMQSEENT